MILWPGDIVCYRGGSLLAKAIRWATREGGESLTLVNHVGLVTEPGPAFPAKDAAIVVEALNRVVAKPFHKSILGKQIWVFRPRNISQPEVDAIVAYMRSQVGRRYGYHKLLLHLLRKVKIPGKWSILNAASYGWLRSNIDTTPICSYIVAEAYAQAGFDFGVKSGLATPDDIWDFCVEHRDKYSVLISPSEEEA